MIVALHTPCRVEPKTALNQNTCGKDLQLRVYTELSHAKLSAFQKADAK